MMTIYEKIYIIFKRIQTHSGKDTDEIINHLTNSSVDWLKLFLSSDYSLAHSKPKSIADTLTSIYCL